MPSGVFRKQLLDDCRGEGRAAVYALAERRLGASSRLDEEVSWSGTFSEEIDALLGALLGLIVSRGHPKQVQRVLDAIAQLRPMLMGEAMQEVAGA